MNAFRPTINPSTNFNSINSGVANAVGNGYRAVMADSETDGGEVSCRNDGFGYFIVAGESEYELGSWYNNARSAANCVTLLWFANPGPSRDSLIAKYVRDGVLTPAEEN